MKFRWLFACTLSGCAFLVPKPHDPVVHMTAPAPIAGALRVYYSAPARFETCSFELWPAGTPQPGKNWLAPGQQIEHANGADFAVKPGKYELAVTSCDGTIHASDAIEVARDTAIQVTYRELIQNDDWDKQHAHHYVVLSPTPAWVFEQPPPGYGQQPAQTADCTPDQQLSKASGGDCCSGMIHGNPDPHGPSICGPIP